MPGSDEAMAEARVHRRNAGAVRAVLLLGLCALAACDREAPRRAATSPDGAPEATTTGAPPSGSATTGSTTPAATGTAASGAVNPPDGPPPTLPEERPDADAPDPPSR